MSNKKWVRLFAVLCIIGFSVSAKASSIIQDLNLDATPEETATSLRILILLTVLTLAPSILIMMTGFTRIAIVLSMVRQAIGMQQTPPNQVIVGLSLFLTLFVMMPVINEININAYQPYMEQQITDEEALQNAYAPIKAFMLRQSYIKDLNMFAEMAKVEAVDDVSSLPFTVIISSFITSEIKRAFQIGFFIFIPFIVIDMIVASTLMAMGMMMLPPIMISLPFKIMLFVLIDGWGLTIQTLVSGFK